MQVVYLNFNYILCTLLTWCLKAENSVIYQVAQKLDIVPRLAAHLERISQMTQVKYKKLLY